MPGRRLYLFALTLSVVFGMAACGGHSHSVSTGPQNPPLTISAVSLPTGYVGASYPSTTLTVSGGSGSGYTWSVAAGAALPAGISLSSSGVLTGKPSADGTTSFTVKVTDSANASASAALSMTVKPGVSISTAPALPDAYVGSAYSQTLAATGGSGSGYTWAVGSGSSLPEGLALSATGVLSGKPAAAGAASFSVTVTDSAQNTARAQFTASVKAGITVVTPAALPTAYVGSFYGEQLSATGGSGTGYAWSVAGPAAARAGVRRMTATGLPDGLTLSADGWITGTPTAAGSSAATVTVTDSAGNSASLSLQFTISSGVTITTASALPGGNTGDIYSQVFAAAGGTGSGYQWVSADVPGGLRLSADGVLSGSLPAAKTYTFNVSVSDSAGNTGSGTFTIVVTNDLRFSTPTTLTSTYAGLTYQTAIRAKGGSGGGYVFTVTNGSAIPAGLTLSSAGVLSGKPTGSGTFAFNVTVTDSASNTAKGDFSLTVSPGVTITTPATLPAANVGTAYGQTLAVSGGSGSGYIWTLTAGGASLSAVGLNFSNGVVSGTPTATGVATFTVSVVDSSLTYGHGTFTVAVSPAGATYGVSGQITLSNNCAAGVKVPTITMQIAAPGASTPLQTTPTDANGNYAFNVPNGNYVVTPSISGAASVFWPASISVAVNAAAVSGQNFGVSLGYNVSGTISYGGTNTGRVYVTLINTACGGDGGFGTSLAAPGPFTIHGVSPGNYTVVAWMDTLNTGLPNAGDPSGTGAGNITLAGSDATSADVTISDPSITAPPASNPTIANVTPTDEGVAIYYQPAVGTSGMEEATSYDVQWSTDPSFASVAGAESFAASGTGVTVWVLNGGTAGITGSLSNGQTYYLRARSRNSFGHTAGWSYFGPSSSPTAVQVGAPGGNTVTGTVTIPSAVTVAPGAQLYVGFFDPSTGAIYASGIASPASGDNAYTLSVPSGSYMMFAFLDQNNDGLMDAGDATTTRGRGNAVIQIGGNLTGQNITLPAANSRAYVMSAFSRYSASIAGTDTVTDTYNLNLGLGEGDKLPVALELVSGPQVISPMDISNRCQNCGNVEFQQSIALPSSASKPGDTYTFKVTYSDGSSESLTGAVTAFGDTGQAAGPGDLPTNLQPTGTTYTQGSGSATQPTFTWTDPSGMTGNNYFYGFYLGDNTGATLWSIPGNNSNSQGFPGAIHSIAWGVDPTGGSSSPSIGSLTQGQGYTWDVWVVDANGNSVSAFTSYIAP